MAENIIVDVVDRIMRIRMHRPEKKNALTRDMYSAVTTALVEADSSEKVRTIVLSGTDDCFTAGNDLADFLNDPQFSEESPVVRFVRQLPLVKKPMIAAVNGIAVGIGTTVLLHCDLVFAGVRAQFQVPFVNLGLVPEAASSLLFPLLMGHQRACELLLLGDVFDSEKAYELGLINQVCDDGATLQTAMDAAMRLAAKPPAAVVAAKWLMKKHQAEFVQAAISAEGEQFASRLHSPEAKEAFRAFLEKREPDFSNFV